MSRRMQADGDVFRGVIVHRRMVDNPEWNWDAGWQNGVPRYVPAADGSTLVQYLGPYKSAGSARGQITANTTGYGGGPLATIVDSYVERAVTTWERVGE